MTVLGQSFVKSIVDIGAEGLERDFPLSILFATSHFRAAQSTRDLTANATDSQFHGAGNRLTHCSLVADTLFNLL